MILVNTLGVFSDTFMRRLVSWCCKQLDLPVAYVRKAQFRNRRQGYSGHAWPFEHRICVSVARDCSEMLESTEKPDDWTGSTRHVPGQPCVYLTWKDVPRPPGEVLDDLVRVTAHECAHLMLSRIGRSRPLDQQKPAGGRRLLRNGGSEQQTTWHENKVMEAFLAQRTDLVAAWGKQEPRYAAPALSVSERRQAKVIADLERPRISWFLKSRQL